MSGTEQQPPVEQPEFTEVQKIRDLEAFDEHLLHDLVNAVRHVDKIKGDARVRLEATRDDIVRQLAAVESRAHEIRGRLDSVKARLVKLVVSNEESDDGE